MPDTPHPPFVPGALTTPRQLYRWLDINPQGGPLQRIQTFITIPVFDIDVEWLGYSNIVGEFHVESPNNLSLTGISGITPDDPNYTLCVSYVNEDNTVVRYSLWRADGDVIGATLVPYTGQMIKKNFRFEIWSTNVASVTQTTAISLYTSVRGGLDYRYGVDTSLVSPDTLCTGQNSIGIVTHLTPPQSDSGFWYTSANDVNLTGGAVSSWLNQFNVFTVSQAVAGQRPTYNSVATPKYVQFTGIQNLANGGAFSVAIKEMYIVCQRVGAANTNKIFDGDGASLFRLYNALFGFRVNFTDDDVDLIPVSGTDVVIIRIVTTPDASGFLLNLVTQAVISGYNIDVDYGGITPSHIQLGDSAGTVGDGFRLYDVIGYPELLSDESRLNVLSYITHRFGYTMLALPLTWGACAQPVLND